jgi:hypothetical protein
MTCDTPFEEEVDAKTEDSAPPTSPEGARYGPLEASKPLGTTRLKKKSSMPTASKKAGFAKLADASAAMGANLALARQTSNWLPLSSNVQLELDGGRFGFVF